MEDPSALHPKTLEQETPALISDTILFIHYLYATYGWYILGGFLLCLYAWSKIKPYYVKWRKQRDDDTYAALVHKNPDLFLARQEAIVAARQRLQEEHDRMAKLKAEKAKELERQKREEFLSRQTELNGHRLGDAEPNDAQPGPSRKKDSSFRPEYNPLMGSGGSGGYRPAKKGCPGGGCGKK